MVPGNRDYTGLMQRVCNVNIEGTPQAIPQGLRH